MSTKKLVEDQGSLAKYGELKATYAKIMNVETGMKSCLTDMDIGKLCLNPEEHISNSNLNSDLIDSCE